MDSPRLSIHSRHFTLRTHSSGRSIIPLTITAALGCCLQLALRLAIAIFESENCVDCVAGRQSLTASSEFACVVLERHFAVCNKKEPESEQSSTRKKREECASWAFGC